MRLSAFTRLAVSRLAVAALAVAAAPFAAPAVQAKELVMATVSLTSDDFQLAAAWANILVRGKSDLRITPVETGTVKGLRNVAQGKADLSLIGAPHYLDATSRGGSFKDDPENLVAAYRDMRVLFAMDTGMAQYVVRAAAGIKTLHDLKGKKVSIGRPGGNAGRVSTILFQVHGLEVDKDYTPQYLDFGPALEQLGNGQIDAALVWGGLPQSGIDNASRGNRLRFVSPDADSLTSFQAAITNGAHYLYRSIPGSRVKAAYNDRVDTDDVVRFWTFPFMVMVRADMPEDTAYALSKALWENVDEVRSSSAALGLLDIERATQGLSAPLHPGAARYLKERGVN